MRIGIVGAETSKFTAQGEAEAKEIIRGLLAGGHFLVSGGCHLGGVDIWAEEIQRELGGAMQIHYPPKRQWEGGYKVRNELIARDSEIVHCIAVRRLPHSYSGMVFEECYHCHTDDHIKSGGCWTMHKAMEWGKKGQLHILDNREDANIVYPAFENHPLVTHISKAHTVYVGRPSKYGNPYVIGVHGDRLECIELFRKLVARRMKLYPSYKQEIINELRGQLLGCHCDPLPCHATILAEIANG